MSPAPRQPLLVLCNDDGIGSPGLLATVRALAPLGRLLVVAPVSQASAWGRAMPRPVGETAEVALDAPGADVRAWSVDASPALAVRWGLLTRAERTPDLVVSGINYGENLGMGIATSGTVGAALEAAGQGLPALAISLETDISHHMSHSDDVDFGAAARITRRLVEGVLRRGLPPHADALSVNIPSEATAETPWRWTHVSRLNYYESMVSEAPAGRRLVGYRPTRSPERAEAGSDIRVLAVERAVSISPLTLDMTARRAPDWLSELEGPA